MNLELGLAIIAGIGWLLTIEFMRRWQKTKKEAEDFKQMYIRADADRLRAKMDMSSAQTDTETFYLSEINKYASIQRAIECSINYLSVLNPGTQEYTQVNADLRRMIKMVEDGDPYLKQFRKGENPV